jgi:uncharacterized membrane protein YbaN (DUF454 family)
MGTLHPIKKGRENGRNAQKNLSRDMETLESIAAQTDGSLFAFKIAHAIPGRLRLVFPALKEQRDSISQLADYLSAQPGVNRVNTNHFCASITVLYDDLQIDNTFLTEHLKCLKEKDLESFRAKRKSERQALETTGATPKGLPVKSSILWTMGGTFFVAMSFLGVIIPGLPTPPFVILAAYCYLRGSERHYRWLMNHPLFGKLVEETESGPRIRHKAKKVTVYFLWFSIFLSCIFFVHSMTARMMLVLLGFGASYYMLRK